MSDALSLQHEMRHFPAQNKILQIPPLKLGKLPDVTI